MATRWTQQADARTKFGSIVPASNSAAYSFCLLGGIEHIIGTTDSQITYAIADTICYQPGHETLREMLDATTFTLADLELCIIGFNDSSSQEDVVRIVTETRDTFPQEDHREGEEPHA